MLDIIEIAKEKGIEEGKILGIRVGIQEGKTLGIQEAIQERVLNALTERFSIVSARVSEQIRTVQNTDVLRSLFHHALRCQNPKEFEAVLQEVMQLNRRL